MLLRYLRPINIRHRCLRQSNNVWTGDQAARPSDRDESMRIDSPGGDEVDLHRRCWIGRGGTTPAGCVRVSATALGYDSDLDFVFPFGSGVFKAGRANGTQHALPGMSASGARQPGLIPDLDRPRYFET